MRSFQHLQVGGNAGSAFGPLLAAAIIIPYGQGHVAWFGLFAVFALFVLYRISRWYANHLNLFKLKQGWRHRYHDSPYRTLLALRMRRAHLLLENGCQVAQAGWQVGYRHPANFSAAFSRYFGYAAKTVGRAGV